jgi:hypothetical protein
MVQALYARPDARIDMSLVLKSQSLAGSASFAVDHIALTGSFRSGLSWIRFLVRTWPQSRALEPAKFGDL